MSKKTDKQSLTYTGGGSMRVSLRDGTVKTIRKNDTIKRGDIPNDAFEAFSVLPSFGATLEEYRRSRAHYVGPAEKPEPKPKAFNKAPKVIKEEKPSEPKAAKE